MSSTGNIKAAWSSRNVGEHKNDFYFDEPDYELNVFDGLTPAATNYGNIPNLVIDPVSSLTRSCHFLAACYEQITHVE